MSANPGNDPKAKWLFRDERATLHFAIPAIEWISATG